MISYIEILDKVAIALEKSPLPEHKNCANGGGTNAEWTQARSLFLCEIVRDELGIDQDQYNDLFARFYSEFEAQKNWNLFPTNSSSNRQALEDWRKGDDSTSPKAEKRAPMVILHELTSE